jgi:hypothetical protein
MVGVKEQFVMLSKTSAKLGKAGGKDVALQPSMPEGGWTLQLAAGRQQSFGPPLAVTLQGGVAESLTVTVCS